MDGKPDDRRDDEAREDADTSKEKPNPAGPHARKDLTNEDATPGAGIYPGDKSGDEVDSGGG